MSSMQQLQKVLQCNRSGISSLSFSRDGRFLFSGGDDSVIRLWNVDLLGRDDKHACQLERELADCAFARYGGELEYVYVCDGQSESHVLSLQNGHHHQVRSLSVNLDDTILASSGEELTVSLWDLDKSVEITKQRGHLNSVACIDWLDRHILVSGSDDGNVCLWDTRYGKCIQQMKETTARCQALTCSDFQVCVGSSDGVLYTYDMRRGKRTAQNIGEPIISLDCKKNQQLIMTPKHTLLYQHTDQLHTHSLSSTVLQGNCVFFKANIATTLLNHVSLTKCNGDVVKKITPILNQATDTVRTVKATNKMLAVASSNGSITLYK